MGLSQERRKLIGRLRARKTRVREGLVLVEGVRAVGEVLDCGTPVRFGVAAARLSVAPEGDALLHRLSAAGTDMVLLSDQELAEISDTERHQGVMLVVAQPVSELEDVARGPHCLVLDGVQDPGNVGTLIRAAVAFSIDGVIALDGTVDPWSPKAVRASAGAVFRIPVVGAAWPDAERMLRDSGLPILVADAGGASVRGCVHRGTFALVLGNEGAGVREAVRMMASGTVSVPMSGPAESLNVGMAGSVLLFELTQEALT